MSPAGVLCGLLLAVLVNGLFVFLRVVKPNLPTLFPPLIKPKQIKKTAAQVLELKSQYGGLKAESCQWLNYMLRRCWFEYSQTGSIQSLVSQKILEEMVDIKRTPAGVFLRSYQVEEVVIGKSPPTFSDIVVVSKQTKDSDITLVLSMSFSELAFTASLETNIGVPISLRVHLKNISGKMAFQYSPQHFHTISFAFLDPPNLDIEVDAVVLHRNGILSKLLPILVPRIARGVIAKTLTLPSMKTKWFLNKPAQPPYPWEVDDPQKMYDWRPSPPPHAATASSSSPNLSTPQSPPSPTPPPAEVKKGQEGMLKRHSSVKHEPGDIHEMGRLPKLSLPVTQREKDRAPREHKWELTNFTSPSLPCKMCGQVLWGSARQGYKCSDCGIVAHERCRALASGCSTDGSQPPAPSASLPALPHAAPTSSALPPSHSLPASALSHSPPNQNGLLAPKAMPSRSNHKKLSASSLPDVAEEDLFENATE